MRIAIVHDWLVTYAGAEKVLEQMLEVYPEAELYSIVDFIPESERNFLKNKNVNTSFIQKLPGSKKHYRKYLPLMPLAIEQFDLSSYDLIISSSHAVAKGVITGPDQLHISYVHSPIRYAWDLQYQYLKESGLEKGFKGWVVRYLLHRIRKWDVGTSNRVDYFIANSHFIQRRINKVYRRESSVIYPPVSVNEFKLNPEKQNFFLAASRLVPYKRIDLIVKAFIDLPEKHLKVIGFGPEYKKLKKLADGCSNIEMMGYQSFDVLQENLQNAKAFIFAAEEDFGILPVEAQACGTPVIGYGKGGLLDTVLDGETGLFFYEQTTSSLVSSIEKFDTLKFDFKKIRQHSLSFSNEVFKEDFKCFVQNKINSFKVGLND